MKQGMATHGQTVAPGTAAEHPFAAVVRTVGKGEKLDAALGSGRERPET